MEVVRIEPRLQQNENLQHNKIATRIDYLFKEDLVWKFTGPKLYATRTFHCGIFAKICPSSCDLLTQYHFMCDNSGWLYTSALHVRDVKWAQKIKDPPGFGQPHQQVLNKWKCTRKTNFLVGTKPKATEVHLLLFLCLNLLLGLFISNFPCTFIWAKLIRSLL